MAHILISSIFFISGMSPIGGILLTNLFMADFLGSLAAGVASALFNDVSMEQQFNRNVDLWHMQNRYNHPGQQLKRLKEAGLNPLYYGLDGNSASAPQPAPTAPVQSPFETMLVAKQLQEMQGNIKVANATADKTSAEADAQRITNEFLRDELTYKNTSLKFQANYDALRNEWYFNTPVDGNASNMSWANTYAWKEFESKYKEARALIAKSEYDEKYFNEKKDIVIREINDYINSLDYDTNQKQWLAKQAEQMFNNLVTQGEQQQLDFSIDKSNKDFSQKMGIFGQLCNLVLRIFGK